MNSWKKFWNKILFCLWVIVLLPVLPISLNSDCGPTPNQGFRGYTFLHPGLADPTAPGAPFFLDYSVLYEKYGMQSVTQVQDNVNEWWERFCKIPTQQDIYRLVYQSTGYDLAGLRECINNKRLPLPVALRGNSFARHLKNNDCTETVEYLIFAKECEPYVTIEDAWELEDNNTEEMRTLIENGMEAFNRTKSFYIRLRYAYQLVRMAHYLKDYKLTLQLYDYLMPKIDNDPSIIEYWIMGHRAGAILALGGNVEASYLYALIFENCPSKRESAYRSFDINSDEEWQQCLLRCKDDKERATLYALRANGEYSKGLEDMEMIYQLDPQSLHLDVLLIKELKKLERDFLGLEFNPNRDNNRRKYKIPRPGASKYIIDFQAFVRRHSNNTALKHRALWKLAEGYLELLAGDYYQANLTLQGASKLAEDDIIKEQLNALKLVAEISSYREVNSEVEEKIAGIMLDNPTYARFPDFARFVHDKLAWLYKANDKEGKYYLQKYDLNTLKVNPKLDVIDDLLALTEKSQPNRLERAMIRRPDGSSIREDLLNIKGTYLMARGELVAAYEVFKGIDVAKWEDYGMYNPFEERLNDCMRCPRDSLQLYSKPQIINRILDLEYAALADREKGARYFYQIGLAHYNMSYFGYAWQATDFFRSGSSLQRNNKKNTNEVPHPVYPLGNLENFNNDLALQYFDRVVLLANNPELSASAAFMAAKCEQNQYFAHGGERSYKYFDLLKTTYSNTLFYQKAIDECKYFKAYVSQ